jgi:hypothetical protein
MPFSIRPVQEGDTAHLMALHASVGWPRRSEAGWRWLINHPARLEAGAPAGWFLVDANGTPRGHTGNFVQTFWRGDTILHGTSGYSIMVEPAARGRSRLLLKPFAEQPGMFARYTFNANPKSSPLAPSADRGFRSAGLRTGSGPAPPRERAPRPAGGAGC